MTAVLTRDGDYFIPLEDRYRKAREAKADLFISIHADAFTSSDARGSSVWVLSPRGATNEASRWLADRENRADLVGGISLDDKDDTLAKVLLDLSQGATMGASSAVAEQVLSALRKLGPTHRTYVERANFVVLRSPDVPSILVETAFISNPAEEARLKSPDHRDKLASAILGGVNDYFRASPPPGTLFAKGSNRERDSESERAARTERYVVNRGDTLRTIAERHGMTTAQLRAVNELADERVRRAKSCRFRRADRPIRAGAAFRYDANPSAVRSCRASVRCLPSSSTRSPPAKSSSARPRWSRNWSKTAWMPARAASRSTSSRAAQA